MPRKSHNCQVFFVPKSSRSLHEILNARKLQRNESRRFSKKDLQKSVLKLLDSHQNFDKLLQEIQENAKCSDGRSCGVGSICIKHDRSNDPSPSGDTCSGDTPSGPSSPGANDCKDESDCKLEVESITSCLEHQATLTGVPISLLAAKKCATLLYDVILQSEVQEKERESVLLNPTQDYMCKVELVAKLITRLDGQHSFHRGQFVETLNTQIQSSQSTVRPWLLWYLHKEAIMPFDLFVTAHMCHQTILSNFAANLAILMIPKQRTDEDQSELCQRVFMDLMIHLIQVAYPSKDASSSGHTKPIKECMKGILETLFAKFIEATTDKRTSLPDGICLLPMERIQRCVSKESCQQFAIHHITQLLCHNPIISVTDAISKQNEWSFAKACPLVVDLFKQLLMPLQETDAVGLLGRILDQEEVNWQSTLIYTSTIAVFYPLAQELIKNCVADFIEQAFVGYEEDLLICAFLLVRQAANEGPHVFPSYATWFKETFSSASSPVVHRKAFSFLMEFLTKLVPHESAVCLRAHVQHPPSAPSKCQETQRDYMLLAKTRLSDLNESWKDTGVPGSSKQTIARSARPQDQARDDVNIAVESFEKNNRIPTNVLEASIFRRPYYVTHFLPALLTPRMLPDTADGKMKLIESLKIANKIPTTLYQQYEEACAKELNALLDGAFSEEAMEDCLEPIDALNAGLDKLKGKAVRLQSSQNDDTILQGELTAQVTLLSDKIATALGLDAPPSEHLPDIAATLHIKEIKPNTQHKQVAELVLDAFDNICKSTEIMKGTYDGDDASMVRMMWAHQLVLMLSRFTELCSALYQRMWGLFCQEGQSKSDATIVGGACFLLFTHSLRSHFPAVSGTQLDLVKCKVTCTLLEAIVSGLSMNTSQEMMFAARLTTALIHLSLCLSACGLAEGFTKDESKAAQLPNIVLEKFSFLMLRVCPETREMRDDHHMKTNDEDELLVVGRSVFSSHSFQKMQPESKLSYAQWISYELDVKPHKDILTELERHDYHQWALLCHFVPLPISQGGCGGCLYQAVNTLINGLMDYEIGGNHLREISGDNDDGDDMGMARRHSGHHTCWRELLQSLQELIPMVDFIEVIKERSGDQERSHDTWLLSLLHERLAKKEKFTMKPSDTCFSTEAIEIQAFMRIVCCLPPYLLFSSQPDASPQQNDLEALSSFINTHLREQFMETWNSLPYLATAHLIKGLVRCSQRSADVLLKSTPLLLASVLVHWRRIKPLITQSYKLRPMPTIFESISQLYITAEKLITDTKDSTSATCASKKLPSTSSLMTGSSTLQGDTMGYPSWLCGLAYHEAVKRRCSTEEKGRVLNTVMQIFAEGIDSNKEVRMNLLECVIAEESWNIVCGKTCQQQSPYASQTITQHVTLLMPLIQARTDLQNTVIANSAVELYPLVIMRSLLPIRSQMQPLLSQHAQLIEVLVQTHNALGDLYCRSGGEPLQPTRGLRRIFKPDKVDVLSMELMLSCSRFIQSCVSVCPPANLRRIKTNVITACNDELRVLIKRYLQDR